MKICQLTINNFRGIRNATLNFDNHTLLVGRNNIGKSTICEAIDLTLGPDRINRLSAIDEFDFYNGKYLSDNDEPIEIQIQTSLIDMSDELKSIFNGHLEFWHTEEKRVLEQNEIDKVDDDLIDECLRIKFIGHYDLDEDEFITKTYYVHPPVEENETPIEVTKKAKRQIGFLYLRALRTGNRALSLERGSLLDILLRVGEIRPRFWEETRNTLLNLDPPLDSNIGALRSVLDNIEQRVGQYIPLSNDNNSTTLHVSQLTRDHLRKTLSFFMSSSTNQLPVPFQRLGTGTLSTLVFALLSAIAELKKENIIFAMEEPELAIPPHTQRRIIEYLFGNTTQSLLTSHSPYVIEKFDPEQITILTKDDDARVSGKSIDLSSGLKPKNYRRNIRHAIAEVILGNAVIVGEGLTELEVLSTASRILEQDNNHYPLDLSGVTIFEAGGDGTIIEFGKFFKSIGLKTYAFFDYLKRTQKQKNELDNTFDFYKEIPFKGIEDLLVEEIPINIQWEFLNEIEELGELTSGPSIPEEQPTEDEVRNLTSEVLRQKKGERRASNLVGKCSIDALPETITIFLKQIYSEHKQPEQIKPIDFQLTEESSSSTDEI